MQANGKSAEIVSNILQLLESQLAHNSAAHSQDLRDKGKFRLQIGLGWQEYQLKCQSELVPAPKNSVHSDP